MSMNCRKARSYSEPKPEICRVPFSWEEKPGTPKLNLNPDQSFAEKPAEIIRTATHVVQVPLRKSTSFDIHSPASAVISWGYSNLKLSPPPIRAQQRVPSRSSSSKGFWKLQKDDDPFAAAIKKCTKGIKVQGIGPPNGRHQNCIQPYKERNHRVNFSCKTSCDVKDDNLVRLVNCIIPPLPRGKSTRVGKGN